MHIYTNIITAVPTNVSPMGVNLIDAAIVFFTIGIISSVGIIATSFFIYNSEPLYNEIAFP